MEFSILGWALSIFLLSLSPLFSDDPPPLVQQKRSMSSSRSCWQTFCIPPPVDFSVFDLNRSPLPSTGSSVSSHLSIYPSGAFFRLRVVGFSRSLALLFFFSRFLLSCGSPSFCHLGSSTIDAHLEPPRCRREGSAAGLQRAFFPGFVPPIFYDIGLVRISHDRAVTHCRALF